MGSFDLFAWVWAGPFILAFVAIDVMVAISNWREDHQKRQHNERSGGDGG